ncbi:MAG: hypothetical protein M1835_002792 [Candelina submexicana]|nr:MAG: hypothetical protein M1835_002792 [Candelina submexicana]
MHFSRRFSVPSAVPPPLSIPSKRRTNVGTAAAADTTRDLPISGTDDASLLTAGRGCNASYNHTAEGHDNKLQGEDIFDETDEHLHHISGTSIAGDVPNVADLAKKVGRDAPEDGCVTKIEESSLTLLIDEEISAWNSDGAGEEAWVHDAKGSLAYRGSRRRSTRESRFSDDEDRQRSIVSDNGPDAPDYDDEHEELSDTEEWEYIILTPSFVDLLTPPRSDVFRSLAGLRSEGESIEEDDGDDDWETSSESTASSEAITYSVVGGSHWETSSECTAGSGEISYAFEGVHPNQRLRRSQPDHTKSLRQRYLDEESSPAGPAIVSHEDPSDDEGCVNLIELNSQYRSIAVLPLAAASDFNAQNALKEDIHRQFARFDFGARRGSRRLLSRSISPRSTMPID